MGTTRIIPVVALGISLLWVSIAHATDGNTLLSKCSEEPGVDRGFCLGYVIGVTDANFSIGKTSRVCFPDNVTQGQLEKIVVKHLEDNPGTLHYDASVLVVTALELAFPC